MFFEEPKQMTIASHSGSFHADDVVGTMILKSLMPSANIIRTRDTALIDGADFVVDVGGVYDSKAGRFDHHQKSFTVKRRSGVGYASAGLVWREFGAAFIKKHMHDLHPTPPGMFSQPPTLSDEQLAMLVQGVDDDLIQYLDRADTGEAVDAPGAFGLSAMIAQFNVTWIDQAANKGYELGYLQLMRFKKAMSFAHEALLGVAKDKLCELLAATAVREAERLVEEPRILILQNGALPWEKVVVEERTDVLFVLYPDSTDNQYQVRTVPVAIRSYVARADLPAAWGGLRDKGLADATGVADAAFCHTGLFIAGAYSLRGAAELAVLALSEFDSK